VETCLYEGRLTHLRRTPEHRFDMRLFALYVDLAELDAALAGRWLCSATRPAPLRIRRSDYPGDPTAPLEASIRDLVARSLGMRPSGPIRLLTQPRMFGYGFNPVSFFYCFDSSGAHLEAVVAHVTNTPWNEQHCYVIAPEQPCATTLRARCAKRFHVSPFLPMDLDHEFTFDTPGDRLLVHIADVRGGERLFEATMSMRRRPITSTALAMMIVRYPLLSARMTAGIYWHALRLHRKGAPFFAHPGAELRNERAPI
jgi:DUF1365 family protein